MPADGISAATFTKRRLRRVSVLWAIPDKQWLDYVIVGRPNAKHNRRRKIKVRHCHAWVAREQGATKQKCEMALNDSLCPGASVRRNAAILPVLGLSRHCADIVDLALLTPKPSAPGKLAKDRRCKSSTG